MKGFSQLFGLGAIALLTQFQLQAQTTPTPMSLRECAQYAVQHSPQIRRAELDVQKGEHKIKEYLSVGYPQVNASGQFIYNVELPTQLLPGEFFGAPGENVPVQFGTTLNSTAGIEVNQLVFSKTFFLGIDATRKLTELNKLVVAKTREQVVYEVAKLYYQAQFAAKQKAILQANLDQVNRLLNLVKKQQENGFAKKTDVDQLWVNKVNLENQLQNLDLQLEQLSNVLKFQMAMPLDQAIVLTDTIDERNFQAPQELSILSAPDFSRKTELALLDMQNTLNKLNVERYRSGYWPSAYAFGSYNIQGQGNNFRELGKGDRWFRYGLIGLSIQVPIFDGFLKKSQIAQANIDIAQVTEDRRMAVQGLQLQHSNARQQLQTQLNNLKSLTENRRVAEEVYRVAQKRFTEGVAPITEVLTAETSMRQAQTNYLSALIQLKWAELDLQNTQGSILAALNL